MSENTKVFISYSRKNRDRIDEVYDALNEDPRLTVFRDTDDILPTEEWRARLKELILKSDVIVFALSPDSASSVECAWELEVSEGLNKKIIPVVVENVEGEVPEAVAKLNYVFLTSSEDLGRGIAKIKDAIWLDIEWVREHTRLGELADRWQRATELGAQPLRGKELEVAEDWLASQPLEAPRPTKLHRQYIRESRKSQARRQRISLSGVLVALLVVSALGAFAWIQRGQALDASDLARKNAEAARLSEEKAVDALRRGTEVANTLVYDISDRFRHSQLPLDVQKSIIAEASSLQDSLIKSFANDQALMIEFANSRVMMAQVVIQTDGASGAIALLDEAISIFESLDTDHDTSLQLKRNKAWALMLRGEYLFSEGNLEAALSSNLDGIAVADSVLEVAPGDSKAQGAKASLLISRSYYFNRSSLQTPPEAAEYAQEAVEIRRGVVSAAPQERKVTALFNLAADLRVLANIYRYTGRPDEAENSFKEARGRLIEARELEGENSTKLLASLGALETSLSDFHVQWERYVEALEAISGAVSRYSDLVTVDPANLEWRTNLALTLKKRSDVYDYLGEHSNSLRDSELAIEQIQFVLSVNPGDERLEKDLALIQSHVAAQRSILALRADESDLQADQRPDSLQSRLLELGQQMEELDEFQDSMNSMLDALGGLAGGEGVVNVQVKLDDAWKSYFSQDYAGAFVSQYDAVSTWRDDPSGFSKETDWFVEQLVNLAHYAVLAGEAQIAFDAAQDAFAMDSKNLAAQLNLALAAMYLGRLEVAQGLFLKHSGSQLSDGLIWDEAVKQDFQLLRSIGRDHDLMTQVEAELR